MNNSVNLLEKLKKFDDFWSPRVIAEMNDYQVKIAKFKGSLLGMTTKIPMNCFLSYLAQCESNFNMVMLPSMKAKSMLYSKVSPTNLWLKQSVTLC